MISHRSGPLFYFVLVFLLLVTGADVTGQRTESTTQKFFRKINVQDGLSQASVNCFFEDSMGFMWIGTSDGLNRYDGFNFQIYHATKGDEEGLANGRIQDILQDPTGNLWIATAGGLSHLDLKTEGIITYTDSTVNNYFSSILYDSLNRKIWIAADFGGLKYLELDSMVINHATGDGLNGFVWQMIWYSPNELLLATLNNGVIVVNTSTLTARPLISNSELNKRISAIPIRGLLKLGKNILINMEGVGLGIYNPETEEFRILNTENSAISSNQITSMDYDETYGLLVGTDGGGLNIIDSELKTIQVYKPDEIDPRSLSAHVVRSVFVDSQKNLWIGTYNAGINFVNKHSRGILHYTKKYMESNALSVKTCNAFEEGRDGTIWIGTDKGGLNSLKNGRFQAITKGTDIHSLNDDVVMSLTSGKNDALYIGTYRGGLNVMKDGVIKKYISQEDDPGSISNNMIWSTAEDSDGALWVGTNYGLNRFEPSTGKFARFLPDAKALIPNSHNSIRSLLIDSKGTLWIGSFAGLGKFNIPKQQIEYFISMNDNAGLSNDVILKVFEDSKQRLWLCTFGGGLNLYDEKTRTFKVYDERHGLPSNVVQSMEEDTRGNLWVSTSKGLAVFDPDKEVFKVLDTSYGLQSDIFMRNSSFRMQDGRLLFGGINGFNIIDAEKVEFPDLVNPIVFTDFQIYNTSIKGSERAALLTSREIVGGTITLNYNDSQYFAVQFTLPDFYNADKIKFSYKLDGFDDQWNTIGNERKVVFTNLNSGEYTLRIGAGINNSQFQQTKELKITIIPPFYLRRGILAFYLIFVVAVIFGIIKYRTHSLQKRQVQLLQMVDEKNVEIKRQYEELRCQHDKLTEAEEELRQINSTLEEKVKKRTRKLNQTIDKLNKSVTELDRFVYSASHDLSAPLKSIKGLVYIARIDDRESTLKKHLDYIEHSILKLENVITDLIQFSRNNRMDLVYDDINLAKVLRSVIDSLKFMNGFEDLVFDFDVPESVIVKTDLQRLQMILHNVISNAIKYRDESKPVKTVRLSHSTTQTHWSLRIEDNGVGIGGEHMKKVFNMFYRATELSDGTGLGLFIVKEAVDRLKGHIDLDSVEGEGSSFTIQFPN